uniref:Uncharacterized protein n=1 Tax=Bactrocera dorsalis TaxID=27457 RepID=A0A034VVI9_BACDO
MEHFCTLIRNKGNSKTSQTSKQFFVELLSTIYITTLTIIKFSETAILTSYKYTLICIFRVETKQCNPNGMQKESAQLELNISPNEWKKFSKIDYECVHNLIAFPL